MAQYETVTKLKSVLTGNLHNTINEVEEQSICVSDIIAFSNQFGAGTVMTCLRELL